LPSLTELIGWPGLEDAVTMTLRLLVAATAGGLLGAERESVGKAAGLRTHMLVAMASALFVIAVGAGDVEGDVSRVIQGIAAGIGFIGAGTILKQTEHERVTGLTTAASVWLTAAIGVAAGVGTIWLVVVATLFAWIVLNIFVRAEVRSKDDAVRR
jgi:putative Mg2+ transporter-C (MgtC) family protein